MTVPLSTRTFDAWSQANGRSQNLPIAVLKDTAIGIDADSYLRKLLVSLNEPLVSALGGFPYSLGSMLMRDVRDFRDAGIKPLFVFSGLDVAPTEKPFSAKDDSALLRTRGWDLYDGGRATEAVDAFSQAGVMSISDLIRLAMRFLADERIEFQVAPYAVWPQLAYLQDKGYIDAVFSRPEMFLFDIEKVILSFNFPAGDFTFVNKSRLRSDVALSNEQLVDAILMSGCSFLRPFPPLENSATQFSDAVSLLKRLRTVSVAIGSHSDAGVYLGKFRKARAAVKHHVIMTEDGKVEQLDFHDSPNDVHEFIGQRLPEELYFYLSRGMIGPQVLNMITTCQYAQAAPLDNNESEEQKRFLGNLNEIRTESLSLLARSMHRYWQNREVKVYNWFDAAHPKSLVHKEIPYPLEVAQNWTVMEEVWKPVRDQQKQWGEFAFCITSLEDEAFVKQTLVPKPVEKLLTSADDIRLNTLWRVLQLRRFIDAETHALTPWGRALVAAIKNLDTEDESLIMPLFVALELYRMKILKAENFTPSFSGAPVHGSDEDKANNTLISRVCALVNMDHNSVGYTGPLSRSVLAFNGFGRALTRELRNLTETTLVNMLMGDDAEREGRDDWSDLGLLLPFIDEANSCLGIAAKSYLDELCSEEDPTSDDVKSKHMGKLRDLMPQAIDIIGDLELGFRVWDGVLAGIKVLQSEGVMEDEAKTFLTADKWLAGRR